MMSRVWNAELGGAVSSEREWERDVQKRGKNVPELSLANKPFFYFCIMIIKLVEGG